MAVFGFSGLRNARVPHAKTGAPYMKGFNAEVWSATLSGQS